MNRWKKWGERRGPGCENCEMEEEKSIEEVVKEDIESESGNVELDGAVGR